MSIRNPASRILRPAGRSALAAGLIATLGGCNMVVMNPAGDVAVQQANLVVIATALMLLIIVPVLFLIAMFAWKYRAANKDARYEPDWDHSTQLELVIWAAPLLVIICLGAVTWVGTHLLDPYRPIERIAPGQRVAAGAKPLEVQVVALDWKWLFIYPEYGIATVNDLAAPIDRPIAFRITSSTVMNSFYIPALAGQIYAMPGMETRLHAVINRPGDFAGFSANYSGAGFSGMRFRFHGMDDAGFARWVAAAKAGGGVLDRATYLQLERPSEKEPVRRYARIDPKLYDAALNLCVEPGKLCMAEVMRIDARGGTGMAGVHTVTPLEYDKSTRRGGGPAIPTPACPSADCATPAMPQPSPPTKPHPHPSSAESGTRRDDAALVGAGLARPGGEDRRDAPGNPPRSPLPFSSL
jgi:cytochrome o ubiquinol oxidase subunit 2